MSHAHRTGLVVALLASACGTPLSALTARKQLRTAMGPITVRSLPASTLDDPAVVANALENAGLKIKKWGELEQPVEIYVLPTHGDLEAAVRRRGFVWLRAWAQYDHVLLQAPSTWSSNLQDVTELLAHELTHCLMYQRSGTRDDWAKKGIPLWFREGMASWTADQGYRWMSLEDLATLYERGRDQDPIVDAEALYQSQSGAVYAAAHHAFTFLINRYGRDAVERTLHQMSKGAQFDDAFLRGVGLEHAKFTAEFRRYIVWRAFRGIGKPLQ